MNMDMLTKKILANPERRWDWIIWQLKMRDSSLAQVARNANVQRAVVLRAKRQPYPRIERKIADALNTTPQILFPERYDADGLPNRKRGRPRINGNKIPTKRLARNVHRPAAE